MELLAGSVLRFEYVFVRLEDSRLKIGRTIRSFLKKNKIENHYNNLQSNINIMKFPKH